MVIITLFSCSSEERVPEIDMSVFRNRNLPWDLSALQKVPRYSYLDSTSSVREILFEGPVHYGKKTKVFAYYSNPDILRTGKNNAKEFPGVVLISGGDQEAIREWVERWAYQGYSAINCDYGNMRKMPDGVPVSSVAFIYDSIKYGIQSVREYRSVEIAIMAHSLLLSFTEVDKQRTGVTGISWGGFQTCIVAGLDNRFKAAAPVYGCGFHDETIFNKFFKNMNADEKAMWLERIDPKNYVPYIKCPILFINGNKDGCFDIIPWHKTTQLVKGKNRELCLIPDMGHSHPDGWRPPEIAAFFNSVLNDGIALPQITIEESPDSLLRFHYESRISLQKADFYYSNDTVNINAERVWNSIPARITEIEIVTPYPEEGFFLGFLFVKDVMGISSSSELIVNH